MEDLYTEVKEKVTEKARQYLYYIIIGIVSFVSLVFLPMVGSTIGLGWAIPNTVVGWVVWVATKLIIASINILVFHSFIKQGKLNVRNDPQFKEAQQILLKQKEKNQIPRSPAKWNAKQYGTKGVTIFITTGLATVALTQAILTFDWVSFLSYLFVIIMGLILGVLQMKKTEDYYTDEYYRYALYIQEKNNANNNSTQSTEIKESYQTVSDDKAEVQSKAELNEDAAKEISNVNIQ